MPEPNRRVAIVVPWRTLLKIIAAAVLVWLWLQLVQVVLVIVVAVLLAVTLNPIVEWFERRRLPRWAGSVVVGLLLLAVVGGFLWMTWTSLSSQARYVVEHFSEVEREVLDRLPQWVRDAIGSRDTAALESHIAEYALRLGQSALSAVVVTVLGFILTLYLLIEGAATRDWILAFVPRATRARVEQTLGECEQVIFAYAAGNVITSIFATAFVGVSLSVLNVPAALLLAVLAGVCDFIPVLGFIASALPAILLAMTVSTHTALIVAALYVAYHGIENYLLAPWAYGDRLKLSNLAVVLAFVVGAEIAGVVGALIALPIAAAYPAIERLWLREKLPDDTLKEHRAIEERKAG
jgi:predicted PurR-regulated permease PerM